MSDIQRGKIVRGDLANWDGKTRTASRVDATGGTVEGLTVGDVVDVLQVFGSGTSRTDETIQAAINFIGTSPNATLLFSTGTWNINDDVTVPANLSNRIAAGCTFSIASAITLTFAGPVHVEYSTATGTGWYSGNGAVSCSVGATGFPGW